MARKRNDWQSKKYDKLAGNEKDVLDFALKNDGVFVRKTYLKQYPSKEGNISRTLGSLKKKGFLEPKADGLYLAVNKREGGEPPSQNMFEAHDIQFELQLRDGEQDELYKHVIKSNISFKQLGKKSQKRGIVHFPFGEAHFNFSRKGLFCMLNEGTKIWAESLNQLSQKIYLLMLENIKGLFSHIHYSMDFTKWIRFETLNCHIVYHIAEFREVVKILDMKPFKIKDDETGREQFIHDFSDGFSEVEAIDPEKAIKGALELKDLLQNFLLNGHYKKMARKYRELFGEKENALDYATLTSVQQDVVYSMLAILDLHERNEKNMKQLLQIEQKKAKREIKLLEKLDVITETIIALKINTDSTQKQEENKQMYPKS